MRICLLFLPKTENQYYRHPTDFPWSSQLIYIQRSLMISNWNVGNEMRLFLQAK